VGPIVHGVPGGAKALLLVLLVVGAGTVVTATLTARAEGTAVKRGGTLRLPYLEPPSADPQFGGLRDLRASQLTLYSFADAEGVTRIRPSAAAGLPVVSRDGRTFTVTIRRGFRFSDGRRVTARNFAFGINRLFNPKLRSPWTYLFEDIVGARAVREGKASSVSGVSVRGDKLVFRLERPRPDFIVRLTNPTIAATPLDMPLVPTATPVPSAGPYYLQEHVQGRRAVFARNPFWRRDLLPWRPANVQRIVFEQPGLTPAEAIEAVERDQIDLALVHVVPSEVPRLVSRHGINRNRLFVRPRLRLFYLVFNHDRPLFRNNAGLKRAINYALDRPEMVRQLGPLGGRRTDQILPPGMPGYRNWDLYPLRGSDRRRAKALARGKVRDGKAVLYTFRPEIIPFAVRAAGVVRFNLAQIGVDVDVQPVPGLARRLTTPGEPWDIALVGWEADYPDPFNFINDLFDGNNLGHFEDAGLERTIRQAARLSGTARLTAFARIDREVMKRSAPIAPFVVPNDVILVSKSVGCFTYDALTGPNLVAICKK
jgi:peptide/nickel transport system substrate-binding protein